MNRNVFLWGLYDLANTPLIAAIGGLYLAQWVVLDNHLDDIWYGGVFTLVTVFILLIAGGLLGLVAASSLPSFTRVILVLVLFFIIQYVYQVSLISYNSLL